MKCFSTAAATFIIPSINVQGCIHVYNYYLLDNLTLLTIHNNDHFVSCHRFCFKIYLILLNIYIANPALFWLLFTYNIFPSFHFVFFSTNLFIHLFVYLFYSRSLLVIYFKYSSVYMSIPNSQSILRGDFWWRNFK